MTKKEFQNLQRAAEQGDAQSQYQLASYYFSGDGVEQNISEAIKWFLKAADQGHNHAMFMLGECYIYGIGVDQSETEAVKWYQRAAEQGDEPAVEALSQIKAGTKIKVLNMVLKKEFALEIVRGKKVREYRAFTPFWVKRLCLFEDPSDKLLATGVKWYDRVHFYPYNNKWFVDCSIESIKWVTVDREFQEKYKDEVIANIGDIIFVIQLGKVLATNLE